MRGLRDAMKRLADIIEDEEAEEFAQDVEFDVVDGKIVIVLDGKI